MSTEQHDREQMARSTIYPAYISDDGERVTTWGGGELGKVVQHSRSRSGGMHFWRVKTPDGREWHGRNAGPSMHIWLRVTVSRRSKENGNG